MKEKSLFSRLFGGGAEAQENPRLNAAREQIIKDAEAELTATRPIDTIADAFARADARRRKSIIANLRGKEELAKQVENTFKMCAGAGLSSVLLQHGLSPFIKHTMEYANILWPLFKEELLKGDAWLVRADQKDYSRLTEEERRFFEKGGLL